MKRALAAIAVLYLLAYILPLGVLPLFSPDETRYAEIPREMLDSGDWVVPRLNGLRYFEKPPLGYWVTALSIAVFGENGFALRLQSAAAVGATALMVLFIAYRLSARPRVGLLAAAVYLTSLEVFAVGMFNVLDSVLAMFLTGAMVSFLLALTERGTRPRTALLCLGGAFCGLAFLTKGFLALVVPAIVTVPFMVLERRFRDLLRWSWIPLAVAIAIVLPWSVLIQAREPDFWRHFFWVEHVSRFLNPEDKSLHREPFWIFLPILGGSLALWIPLLPAVVSGVWRSRRRTPLVRYALLWFLLPFLFFSASGGKIGTYILPCFPPLAILIAWGLDQYFERRGTSLFSAGALLSALGALGGLFAAALLGRKFYGADEVWKWLLAMTALLWWALASLAATISSNPRRRIWIYGSAALLLIFSVPWIVPRQAVQRRCFGQFLKDNSRHVARDAILVADSSTVSSVCWQFKTADVHLFGEAGELEYGLRYVDSAQRLLSSEDIRELVASESRTRDLVLIMKRSLFSGLHTQQPALARLRRPVFEASGQGLVLVRYGHGASAP